VRKLVVEKSSNLITKSTVDFGKKKNVFFFIHKYPVT